MTNIDIISGFLGAGKTTFIKKLLEGSSGEKTVIIENEFGEIGIDSGFLSEAGVEITEMNSGCICCSLVGDFKEALSKVCKDLSPDRIIIEPSGVGKLSDVIEAVKGAENGSFVLRSATAVVDAKKCRMHIKNFGEFFVNQIENANAIILSHSENMTEEKLGEVLSLIREHNEKAEIVSTHYSALSNDLLMKAMTGGKEDLEASVIEEHHHHDGECHCHEHGHEHHHHHADEVFQSIGMETAKTFTEEKVKKILSLLQSGEFGFVLRAKGYLKSEDGFIHFDYIPEEEDVRFGEMMPVGRLCVIGTDLKKEEILSLWEN